MIDLLKMLAAIKFGKVSDEICTISTVGALMEGVYQKATTVQEMSKHGDFGLGTYEGLDGEMIIIGGKTYRATSDGSVSEAKSTDSVAYAALKHFKADSTFDVNYVPSQNELAHRIDSNVQLPNVMLAIKITGTFEILKLRAVCGQTVPYKPFGEVEQKVFEFKDAKGDLVGFRFPEFTGEVSVHGYHFHFISEDRKFGGHVLDVNTRHGHVECDISRELNALLPDSAAFDKAELDVDHLQAIHKAEH